MTYRAAGARIAVPLVLLIAGCSYILSPRPDPSKFFVLNASQSSAPMAGGSGGPVIGLGPVRLPSYLSRDEIATRVASNQVEYSATEFWAEHLDANFRRVMERNLAEAVGNAQIISFPWYRATSFDYRVEVEVERFERDSKGDAHLIARWNIRDGKTEKIVMSRESSIDHPAQSAGTPGAVAALSACVADLGDQIASGLREIQSERTRASQAH